MEKILIAMPCGTGAIPSKMVEFLFGMKLPEGYQTAFLTIDRTPIDIARNEFIKFAVLNGFDWILFLDDDNIPEDKDFLEKMLVHGKKMITGLVPTRKKDNEKIHRLCVFKKDNKKDGSEYYNQYINMPGEGLVEVDMCGAGCFLRHKDVFKALYERYQERPCEAKRLWYYRIGDDWVPEDEIEKIDIKTGTLRYKARCSEDILLFERAKRLTGEKIWADTDVWCTHIGEPKIVNIKRDIIAKNYDLSLTKNE